jgi:hypothetical protein
MLFSLAFAITERGIFYEIRSALRADNNSMFSVQLGHGRSARSIARANTPATAAAKDYATRNVRHA